MDGEVGAPRRLSHQETLIYNPPGNHGRGSLESIHLSLIIKPQKKREDVQRQRSFMEDSRGSVFFLLDIILNI